MPTAQISQPGVHIESDKVEALFDWLRKNLGATGPLGTAKTQLAFRLRIA